LHHAISSSISRVTTEFGRFSGIVVGQILAMMRARDETQP